MAKKHNIGKLVTSGFGSSKSDLFVIDDETINDPRVKDMVYCPIIDGEVKGHGLVKRDYATYPKQMFDPPSDLQLIPESDWDAIFDEQEANKSSLEHVRMQGADGQMIPSLDQNGQGYCAIAGTEVRMADGSLKPIEKVTLGDTVISNSLSPRQVLQTHRRLFTGDIVRIYADGVDGSIMVTDDHPIPTPHPDGRGFFDATAGRWRPGDTLYALEDGQVRPKQVSRVERNSVADLEVYDIGVDREHYFFAGPGSILVHNCWAYSTTMCVMLQRAATNQKYVRLSAHAIGCMVKNFRNEGGWCGLSAKFHRERGCPSVEFWAEKSMSRSNDKPATWENAALHKVTEDWCDAASAVYDQNLTKAQIATLLLSNVSVALDYGEWGHSICGMRWWRVERGSWAPKILNSWTDQWGDKGTSVIRTSWTVDGAVGIRSSKPSPR